MVGAVGRSGGRRGRRGGPGRRPVPVGGDGEPLGVPPGLGLGDPPAVAEVVPAAPTVLAP